MECCWVGRTFKGHVAQPSWRVQEHLQVSQSCPPLECFQGWAFISFLGNLFQCFVTLIIKTLFFFLMPSFQSVVLCALMDLLHSRSPLDWSGKTCPCVCSLKPHPCSPCALAQLIGGSFPSSSQAQSWGWWVGSFQGHLFIFLKNSGMFLLF